MAALAHGPEGLVIAFAGGGTGGHIFPALAVAQVIQAQRPEATLLFFATSRPIDRRLIEPTSCNLITQSLVPFSAKPWRWPRFWSHYRRACRRCRSVLESERPAVLVGTGGLGSLAPVRQALRAGLPVTLLNPDARPGRANQHLASKAEVVFAQWEETRHYLPGTVNLELTGCPTRDAFNHAQPGRALAELGLDNQRKTLVITGASQGARSLNQAVLANLDTLKRFDEWQIVHQTGEKDFQQVKEAYQQHRVAAVVLAFIDRMAETLASADLVVSRAGASTLAELTTLGKPAILLPYPYDRNKHQRVNAQCLVRRQAAIMVTDTTMADTTAPDLQKALERLLGHDAEREAMAHCSRRAGKPDAARIIAQRLIALAGG